MYATGIKTIESKHEDVQDSAKGLAFICVLFAVLIFGRAINNIFFYPFVFISFLVFLASSHQRCFLLLLFLLPSAIILKQDVNSMSFFTILFFITILKMVISYKVISKQFCFCLLALAGYCIIFSGFGQLTTIITMVAGMLMLYYLRWDYFDANVAVVTYSSGICLSSLLALFKSYLPIVNKFSSDITIKLGEGVYSTRFSGLQGNPNYYTLDIIVAISAIIVLMYKHKPQKIHTICIIALSVFGLMSVSKSFLLTWIFLIMFWFFISVRQGIGNVFKFAFIAAITAAVAYFFAYDYINTYLLRFTADSTGSLSSITTGRSYIWEAYMSDILNNSKILFFGNGLNTLGSIRRGVHNTYIECLFSFGVFGTIIFLVTLKLSMGRTINSKILWIPLVALFIRFMAIGILTYDSLWFYLAIILLLSKDNACANEQMIEGTVQ